jgi:leucine efflux protein
LLNPKAIVFYMAFFPLFIDVKHHLGMVTFTFMAITIIVIEILYGLITCSLILKFQSLLRERVSARQWLERIAGVLLLGFAIHLLVSRL